MAPTTGISPTFLCLIMAILAIQAADGIKKITIGAVFSHDSKEMMSAFYYAVKLHNSRKKQFRLKPQIDQLDLSDSYNLTKTLCRRMESGVFAFFGEQNTSTLNVVQSLSRRSNMPFILPNISPVTWTTNSEYLVYMMPAYTAAIVDLIVYYRWTKLHYFYDSDEGLYRLDALYRTEEVHKFLTSIVPWRINDPYNMHATLRLMDFSDKMPRCRDFKNWRNVVVDLSSQKFYQIFIKQISEVGMNKCGYHYLFTSPCFLDLDIRSLTHGGVNLTGLQLLDSSSASYIEFANKWKYSSKDVLSSKTHKQILYTVAMMVDSVQVFVRALSKLYQSDAFKFRRGHVYNENTRGVPCRREPVKWVHGEKILQEIKKVKFEGTSGKLEFDKNGFRRNYHLDIYEYGLDYGPTKIVRWSPINRLTTYRTYQVVTEPTQGFLKNRTIIIISVQTPPYLMVKQKDKNGKPVVGNDRYEGFCADLAKQIMTRGKFPDYIIRPVVDGKHGENRNGTWNGIIGELINRTADLGIADLTITTEREEVVDFSKPFMDVGISIMIKKPEAQKPGVFSFMNPLSNKTWICIIGALVGVSIALFCVTRLSPYERKPSMTSESDEEFGMTCCVWFAIGALMQQGGDVFPRTSAGRVIGSVWWFFTLIIISSYTANLAAFLTIEQMVTPINSAKELAEQSDISYGTLDSGSTKHFFKKSNVTEFKTMWNYMKEHPSVFTQSTEEGISRVITSNGKYAFLLESTTNDYTNNRSPCKSMKVGPNLDSKHYGVASPTDSDIKEQISMIVLEMMEDGTLRRMKKRWWYDKGECGHPDGGSSKDSKKKALSLNNMAGIFYILIGGLTLSMVVGMVELHVKSKNMKKRLMLKSNFRKTRDYAFTNSNQPRPPPFQGVINSNRTETQYTFPDYANAQTSSSLDNYAFPRPSQRLSEFDPYVNDNNSHTQV